MTIVTAWMSRANVSRHCFERLVSILSRCRHSNISVSTLQSLGLVSVSDVSISSRSRHHTSHVQPWDGRCGDWAIELVSWFAVWVCSVVEYIVIVCAVEVLRSVQPHKLVQVGCLARSRPSSSWVLSWSEHHQLSHSAWTLVQKGQSSVLH